MISWFNRGDKKYQEAKDKLLDIYKEINSNIPDYDAFEIPFNLIEVPYPSEAVEQGEVSQKGLYQTVKYRIFSLKYANAGQLKSHTHYGYWEYIFVKEGIFENKQGHQFHKGDTILINGYDPHSIKCLVDKGELVLLFTKDKSLARFNTIKKYVCR